MLKSYGAISDKCQNNVRMMYKYQQRFSKLSRCLLFDFCLASVFGLIIIVINAKFIYEIVVM